MLPHRTLMVFLVCGVETMTQICCKRKCKQCTVTSTYLPLDLFINEHDKHLLLQTLPHCAAREEPHPSCCLIHCLIYEASAPNIALVENHKCRLSYLGVKSVQVVMHLLVIK